MEDIRWEQRFSNYLKALEKLKQSIEYIQHDYEVKKNTLLNAKEEVILNEILKEGLIQRFEYTHELAWNVMKDYAEYQGNPNVGGSRDATREAFQLQLIANGHLWMDMISSRNKTSRTYNEDTANAIYEKIDNEYYPAFLEFKNTMDGKITLN
jgi:nucleotidyltransferase substrate binding protein (TIGR01987 family)